MSSIAIAAYLALFFGVGAVFLFVNLLIGKFVRSSDPYTEKTDIYECGEPPIGSSFVQFDLRFYVVALLFLIFDVEVAFFFPWATVYGKAAQLRDERLYQLPTAQREEALTGIYSELGVLGNPNKVSAQEMKDSAKSLAFLALCDIAIFFAVILVGFAYVWMRGDIDWVRALSRERGPPADEAAANPPAEQEPALAS